MTDLTAKSIEIIRTNQSPYGSYAAAPTFSTYHYCWFRDSSYIAYAMDLAGDYCSAEKFHDWAADVIWQREEKVNRCIRKAIKGLPLTAADYLHTRYPLDGSESDENGWPNFQSDGFGTWLWSLEKHLTLSRQPLKPSWGKAANLAAKYLSHIWFLPCYDCWEEFPDEVHTYTLAAIYGGLVSFQRIGGGDFAGKIETIRQYILRNNTDNGSFVKARGRKDVDASLLGIAIPYQIVEPTSALMAKTVARIENELCAGVGVRRYALDTYYGGGQWILLTCWLGWHYAMIGAADKAEKALRWVENQADEAGNLPEQINERMNAPEYYRTWIERWGTPAAPLLWSHANYLILKNAIRGNSGK